LKFKLKEEESLSVEAEKDSCRKVANTCEERGARAEIRDQFINPLGTSISQLYY
jgi:hypothetical protein